MLAELTNVARSGADITRRQMTEAMTHIMSGQCGDEDIEQLLVALADKGESADELAGAAAAVRLHMTRVRTSRADVLDTCGTGGDHSGTFNISTAAAIVTAAAGVPVAKHGNRGITSKSGSADVLSALGVNVDASLAQVEQCLDEVGICFCFAQQLHPAMKTVASIRRKIGRPTIFNWLGPLCNPAGAPFQLLGVGKPGLRKLMAEVLVKLGTTRALVVCGTDGLDEVTLAGKTLVSCAESRTVREFVWHPHDFGLATAELTELRVAGPAESAHVIRDVLTGKAGPARDIVVLNAAAALWTCGAYAELTDCQAAAADAIDSGQASQTLARLAEASSRKSP